MIKNVLFYLVFVLCYTPHFTFCQKKSNLKKENAAIFYPKKMKTDEQGKQLKFGDLEAVISAKSTGEFCNYVLRTTASLRENVPVNKRIEFSETNTHAYIRTGNVLFDGLYAMAIDEAKKNSVSEIKNDNYTNGKHHLVEAFQAGEKWTYVWTRDLAYSVHLALAGFDTKRSVNSLLFKTSELKDSVGKKGLAQIIQDTGSGGSYPVSTDRVVWALGVWETLKFLKDNERASFLDKIYPILSNTIEQDRMLVYDNTDGLYRGEQSFLDWREQTYPLWTSNNPLPIALSKALSVNVLNYWLLKITSECADLKQNKEISLKYSQWAEKLKATINTHFFDKTSGLYSAYLISDGLHNIRVKRYDLLGNSLAILLGIADTEQSESVLTNYPIGPHGPSVVWPQERNVPIYHNQAIWPFVTAYWIKAACKQNRSSAVNHGVLTMHRLTALNLSNMENYDFVSGQAEIKGSGLNIGPTVNSRHQLWSVAGYLSMVQSELFGLQTTMEGMRFAPYITAELHKELFASTDKLEFRNFDYRGKQNSLTVHLPAINKETKGAYEIKMVSFNGQNVGKEYISTNKMQATNHWDVYLQVAKTNIQQLEKLKIVDVNNERLLYTPAMPEWDTQKNKGITIEEACLKLHFTHPDIAKVTFNIYRDGKCVASNINQTSWHDLSTKDYQTVAYGYAIEAVDNLTGTVSHLSPINRFFNSEKTYTLSAVEMQNQGGTLVDSHHFEGWGKSSHSLSTEFAVNNDGRYVINTEFANGSGPINTGITCSVKRIILKESGKEIIAGYLIMPQSGNWKRWDKSTPFIVQLKAGKKYELVIDEDANALNMSYFENNRLYKYAGGGAQASNLVNIANVEIKLLEAEKSGE